MEKPCDSGNHQDATGQLVECCRCGTPFQKTYCFSRNGAAIKCHDTIGAARAQAISTGLGDTAIGQDCVHPELPNTAKYTVETLVWNDGRYHFVTIEEVAVERNRAAARTLWERA